MNFIDHLQRQAEFSERTFGPGERTKGVIQHIRKELVEIEEFPEDLTEWVDVILLACDGARRVGYSTEEIAEGLRAKLEININRVWPDWRIVAFDKPIEHVRDDETGA